jgi:hypothetical protein
LLTGPSLGTFGFEPLITISCVTPRPIKPFLVLPPEVRIMIYRELVILPREDNSGEKSVLHIRSMSKAQFATWSQLTTVSRSQYVVPGRDWTHSPSDKQMRKNPEYRTTYYCLETIPAPLRALHPGRCWTRVCGGSEPLPPSLDCARHLQTAIILTNSRICEEASEVLYKNHIFDFGNNYAAGESFLQDHLRCAPFLREIGFQKHIMPSTVNDNYYCNPSLAKEARFWSDFCWAMALSQLRIKKLHVHLIGDTVPNSHTGPRTLSIRDLNFLLSIKSPETKWITDIARQRGRVDELVIVESCHPDLTTPNHFLRPNRGPERKWNSDKSYDLLAAAMAGSIRTSVAQCLREQLGI